MANYTGIQGQNILIVSSDPSNPVEGQIWYNTTSQTLKGLATAPDTVATGGNYPQALYQAGSAGTQTAAIGYGGRLGTPRTAASNIYNGSAWTSTPSLNQARSVFQSSFGVSTSALAVNGQAAPPVSPFFVDTVEEWNGSSWSESAETNENRRIMSGIGTVGTSGLVAGGIDAPGTPSVNVEQWNGTSWTEVNNLNTAGARSGGAGDVTAGLSFDALNVESWNGTSWTALTNAPVNLNLGGGTITAVIATGSPGQSILKYNGSAWTTSPVSFSVGHPSGSYAGNPGTAALVFTGAPTPSYTNSTEEFNVGALTTVTITTS